MNPDLSGALRRTRRIAPLKFNDFSGRWTKTRFDARWDLSRKGRLNPLYLGRKTRNNGKIGHSVGLDSNVETCRLMIIS